MRNMKIFFLNLDQKELGELVEIEHVLIVLQILLDHYEHILLDEGIDALV